MIFSRLKKIGKGEAESGEKESLVASDNIIRVMSSPKNYAFFSLCRNEQFIEQMTESHKERLDEVEKYCESHNDDKSFYYYIGKEQIPGDP